MLLVLPCGLYYAGREMRGHAIIAVVLLAPLLAGAGEVLDAKTASGKLGEYVVIEDTIKEVVIKDTGTVFVNFGAPYPEQTFAAVVMKDTRPRFPGIEAWSGKRVHLEGVVTEYEGQNRIILRERGQIALVPATD